MDPTTATKKGDKIDASKSAESMKLNEQSTNNEIISPSTSENTKNTLFVRGIPLNATSTQLESFFSEFGPLRSCFVVENHSTEKDTQHSHRGFGFVQFALHQDAVSAIQACKTRMFEGRKLRVEIALKKRVSKHKSATKNAASPFDMPNPHSTTPKKPHLDDSITFTRPRLIVRNLSFLCTEQDLKSLFTKYGKVIECKIPLKPSGEKRGFGFVEFDTMEHAQKALRKVNGSSIKGRTVAVDLTLPKDRYDAILSTQEPAEDTMSVDEEAAETNEIDTESMPAKNESSDEEDVDEAVDEGDMNDSEQEDEDEDESEVNTSEKPPFEKRRNGPSLKGDPKATLFIRNLSFDSQESDMVEAFSTFGQVLYARITRDPATGRSRGTGFVCFKQVSSASACLEAHHKCTQIIEAEHLTSKRTHTGSVLVPEPSTTTESNQFNFTLNGRFLNIALAVSRDEATKLLHENAEKRKKEDKRNLYLMKEGVIYPDSDAAKSMTATELSKRQTSYASRKKMLTENPNLFISKTRLSIRNLMRNVDEKLLRLVAKIAVDRFWKEAEAGRCEGLEEPVIEEDLKQGLKKPQMGRVVVIKQAKIIRDVARLDSKTEKARSKGYGFIEFQSHADALACLRWLNNNPKAFSIAEHYVSSPDFGFGKKKSLEQLENTEAESGKIIESKLRPIVEFAIENNVILKNRQLRLKKSEEKLESKDVASKKRKRDDKSNPSTRKKIKSQTDSNNETKKNDSKQAGVSESVKRMKKDTKKAKKPIGIKSWNGKPIKPGQFPKPAATQKSKPKSKAAKRNASVDK